jgi:hypothetical protein
MIERKVSEMKEFGLTIRRSHQWWVEIRIGEKPYELPILKYFMAYTRPLDREFYLHLHDVYRETQPRCGRNITPSGSFDHLKVTSGGSVQWP